MNFLSSLESWFAHSAWPAVKGFFGNVVADEVAAATPIVQQTVSALASGEAAALASGKGATAASVAAGVVKAAGQQLEQAGISVGINSLLTAVGSVVAGKAA